MNSGGGAYLIRINRGSLLKRWVVECTRTGRLRAFQSVSIANCYAKTHTDPTTNVHSIWTFGRLTVEGDAAVIRALAPPEAARDD